MSAEQFLDPFLVLPADSTCIPALNVPSRVQVAYFLHEASQNEAWQEAVLHLHSNDRIGIYVHSAASWEGTLHQNPNGDPKISTGIESIHKPAIPMILVACRTRTCWRR